MKEKLQSLNIIATVFIIIMLVFICYKLVTQKEAAEEGLILYNYSEDKSNTAENEPLQEERKEENTPKIFRLYISGAVQSPGVYEIEEGKRIVDLIVLSGGALEDANLDNINLAAYVEDAKHVKIPLKTAETEEKKEETSEDETWYQGNETSEKETVKKETTAQNNGPVNINNASLKELTSLPGIGNVIGQNIINYREAKGPFKSIEEIKNVSRIGNALFNNIKDKITVE